MGHRSHRLSEIFPVFKGNNANVNGGGQKKDTILLVVRGKLIKW